MWLRYSPEFTDIPMAKRSRRLGILNQTAALDLGGALAVREC
jgi:hypothetical protein